MHDNISLISLKMYSPGGYIFSSTFLASLTLPFCNNHRGDSGITHLAKKITTKGKKAPTPNMYRHEEESGKEANTRPEQNPSSIPTLVEISDHVTNSPRCAAGEISEM
jgi:hypothetical protein